MNITVPDEVIEEGSEEYRRTLEEALIQDIRMDIMTPTHMHLTFPESLSELAYDRIMVAALEIAMEDAK